MARLGGRERRKLPDLRSGIRTAKVLICCPAAPAERLGVGVRLILENSTVCQIVDELVCYAPSSADDDVIRALGGVGGGVGG